jgi:hypothetical protein
MNAHEMLDALKAAADVLRRMSPDWCALHDVPQTTDAEFDAALQAVEDAIENAEVSRQANSPRSGVWLAGLADDEITRACDGVTHEAA